ncbi:hypothetical protein CEXT_41771, partial [Caerostris extrusa]
CPATSINAAQTDIQDSDKKKRKAAIKQKAQGGGRKRTKKYQAHPFLLVRLSR